MLLPVFLELGAELFSPPRPVSPNSLHIPHPLAPSHQEMVTGNILQSSEAKAVCCLTSLLECGCLAVVC